MMTNKRLFFLTLLVLLIIRQPSSSANIVSQTHVSIPVNVDDVMTRDYIEISVNSEFLCADATNASALYCYSALRCLTVLSSYGNVLGTTTTPGWTCKTCEFHLCRVIRGSMHKTYEILQSLWQPIKQFRTDDAVNLYMRQNRQLCTRTLR